MKLQNTNKYNRRVKLIFNPKSGANNESPIQLMDVIKEMQAWKLVPEPFMIEPDCDLNTVINNAIDEGIDMFVVCGGDGTVSSVTKSIIGTGATMGIIPTGTQNNVALSLGIPKDIPAAISILRNGHKIKVDIGIINCNNKTTPFIEVCTIGLLSSLFSAGDDIQHGNIARVGDFLATLATCPPSDIHLLVDDNKDIKKLGHGVLISNMPYVIRHYETGTINSFSDGLLDVLIVDGLSKLELVGYVVKGAATNMQDDPRIQRLSAHKIIIETKPNMEVMADGTTLGNGPVQIEVQRHALNIMVNSNLADKSNESGEFIEE